MSHHSVQNDDRLGRSIRATVLVAGANAGRRRERTFRPLQASVRPTQDSSKRPRSVQPMPVKFVACTLAMNAAVQATNPAL